MQAWPEQRKQEFRDVPEYLKESKAGPDTFLDISFQHAQFAGEADFSGRKFLKRLDFTRAHFYQPPVFEGCEGINHLDFYGATIGFSGGLPRFSIFRWQTPRLSKRGWTTDSKTALKLRELRKLADETKNHDLERDLYVEERKAERGILLAQYWREGWKGRLGPRMRGHCLWIAVMGVYWALADYGRRFVRPMVGLALSVFLFHWAYGSVLIAPSDPNRLEDFRRAVGAFSIFNAVPFVGALTLERDVKLTLLCGDIARPARSRCPTHRRLKIRSRPHNRAFRNACPCRASASSFSRSASRSSARCASSSSRSRCATISS
jgi:hypothetical protein